MPLTRYPFLEDQGVFPPLTGREAYSWPRNLPGVVQYPQGLAYPQGAQDLDLPLPARGNALWDQAKQSLMDILSRPRERMFEGANLTPDQIAHNRQLETRLLPQVAAARIQAESTKGVKDFAQHEAKTQKLSTRLTNIEKQMQTVHQKEKMSGNAKKQALRDLANQHDATWKVLNEHDPDAAAMHSRYNVETGMPTWYKEEKGWAGKAIGWAWDKWVGLNEYVQDALGEQSLTYAAPEVNPILALQDLDQAIRKKESPKKAQELIDQVKEQVPVEQGVDPQEIATRRIEVLNSMVGSGKTETAAAPSMRPRLQQRENLLEKYYREQEPEKPRRPGMFESLNSLDRRVSMALRKSAQER